MLVGGSRTWAVVLTSQAGVPLPARELTGAALLPALPALGVVLLAGVVAVVAARGPLRAVIGALLAAAGAAVVVGGVRYGLDPAGATGAPSVEATRWWVVAAAGGLAGAAAGLVVAVRGRSWPAMSGRFERGSPRPSAPGRPADAWDALDRGEDPTDGPPPPGGPGPG